MTSKSFFKLFFSALGAAALLYFLFICIINPEQTSPLTFTSKYYEFHDNFLLRKAKTMEKNQFETMILGSSTSEAYSVQSINYYFKTTSFHGSIGGGSTAARYVLFKKALKDFPNLKRVVYIADFYEFNQIMAPPALAYNSYLNEEIHDPRVLPSKAGYLKYFYSHQLFDSAVLVYKRSVKGYKSPVFDDGSTSVSMILSTVKTESNFLGKVAPENRPKLMEEILENNTTYSKGVLGNFKELNPAIKDLYEDMIKEAEKRNIQIVFILSPYHSEFKKLLFENVDIKTRYGEWENYLESFKKRSGITVYNPLRSAIAVDPESGVWRDGIHYNNYAAEYFLNDITKGK